MQINDRATHVTIHKYSPYIVGSKAQYFMFKRPLGICKTSMHYSGYSLKFTAELIYSQKKKKKGKKEKKKNIVHLHVKVTSTKLVYIENWQYNIVMIENGNLQILDRSPFRYEFRKRTRQVIPGY